MDSQVDRDDVFVAVSNDMARYSNSFEFTQSQQSVEGKESGHLGQ
jgi:hypothetical protein